MSRVATGGSLTFEHPLPDDVETLKAMLLTHRAELRESMEAFEVDAA